MASHTCYNCFREKPRPNDFCPYCGYGAAQDAGKYPLALQPGSILNGRYVVGRVLGQGGFGITYVAREEQTGEKVAIKEYFPESMAARTEGHNVTAYSGQRQENFIYGMECFLSEAKTLAQFIGTENIVRIHSYFEENGTAYFVMDYVDGVSLQTYLKQKGGRISWEEAKDILFPVMDALSIVHSKGIIHRDIAPDNIYITKDGTVKLLDFGAARYSLGNKSHSLDVVLKAGFAPMEQYTRRGRQGPFTDVYAMAATFYNCITGQTPPEAAERVVEDLMMLPSSLGVRLPPEAEDALEQALAVSTYERYQTITEFRQALEVVPKDAVKLKRFEEKITKPVSFWKRAPFLFFSIAATVVLLLGGVMSIQTAWKGKNADTNTDMVEQVVTEILTESIPSEIFITQFTLIYDTNDGTPETNLTVKTNVTDRTFTVEGIPDRQFFYFEGWQAEDGTIYKEGDTYTIPTGTNSSKLTAKWGVYMNDLKLNATSDFLVVDNQMEYKYDGVPGCEVVAFPVKGLTENAKYQLSFDAYYETISDSGFYNNSGHWFGYGFSDSIPDNNTGNMVHDENKYRPNGVLNDDLENASTNHFAHTVVAANKTMYLYFCLCDILDSHVIKMHMDNLQIDRIYPSADTSYANRWDAGGNGISTIVGQFSVNAITSNSVSFNLNGESDVERTVIPINNLVSGKNYQISFRFSAKDNAGNAPMMLNENSNSNVFQYGYCLTDNTDNLTVNPGYTWLLFQTNDTAAHTYTSDFTANDSTAYLILNFANVIDGTPINYELTELTIQEDTGDGGGLMNILPA